MARMTREKVDREQAIAREHIRNSLPLKCMRCNMGFLRERKTKCPFCGAPAAMVIDESKESVVGGIPEW